MSDIDSHIATIGRALWARDGRGSGGGRATVMIGSGFSKNAVSETGQPRPFPTWKDLATYLVNEILPGCDGCTCLSETDNSKYPPGCTRRARRQKLYREASGTSGLMELGQKLEAMKGQALLHGTLRAAIPDLEYGPGKPHQDLVRLPWADILTTNWDTLLEQAIDAYDRSYELIVQPKQLATATAPRIVKLHGCVRSGTKLIFTEEDFRVYPSEYAPFVSLVQQSLMENVFVLIGFSGSDPNFKAWHGWVRDHLGKYLQPVYLVTDKSADSIDVNLFANRLITVVDLSLLDGMSKTADYSVLLEEFFHRLRDYRFKVRENLNWPRPQTGSDEKSYADTLESWRTRIDRRTQWIVLPTANRLELLRRLDDALGQAAAQTPPLVSPPALKALFDDHVPQQRLDEIAGPEFEPSDREKAAILVAETLQIGLAAPGEKLLGQFKSIFAQALLDRLWGSVPGSKGPQPNAAAGPQQPNAEAASQATVVADAQPKADPYATVLARLTAGGKDGGEIEQRAKDKPTLYRGFVQKLLPLIGLLEREARWRDEAAEADQLTNLLRLVNATGAAAELIHWSQLQTSLDRLDSGKAARALKLWTPRANEPVSTLLHAAGLRELDRISEAEIEVRQAVDLLRRLATVPRQHLADASREAWAFIIYSDLLDANERVLDSVIRARGRGVTLKEVVGELAERLDELEMRRCDPRRELDRLARDFVQAELNQTLHAARRRVPGSATNDFHWITSDPAISFLMLAEIIGISLLTRSNGRLVALRAAALLARDRPWLAVTLLVRAGRTADIAIDESKELFAAIFIRQTPEQRLENARAVMGHLVRLTMSTLPTQNERLDQEEITYTAGRIALLLHLMRGFVAFDDAALFEEVLDAACRAHDSAVVEITGTGWIELIGVFRSLVDAVRAAPTRQKQGETPTRAEQGERALNFLERLLNLAEPWPDRKEGNVDPRASNDWPDPFRILTWSSRSKGAGPSNPDAFELREAGEFLIELARGPLQDGSEGSTVKLQHLARRRDQLAASVALAHEPRRSVLARRLVVARALLAT